jgi:hypothetical protein
MIKNLSMKHGLMPENEEPGTFPNRILPTSRQNPKFYGREEELEKIHDYLRPKGDQSLRTYTIYGRRGVGKTEIALQFAYLNKAGFDAIFWIQCETSVAVRQSFTNTAVSLNLPGAGRAGHHEENLLAVQNWLKRTRKKWLLIFDNAERDQVLKPYWPIGASGAILITTENTSIIPRTCNAKAGQYCHSVCRRAGISCYSFWGMIGRKMIGKDEFLRPGKSQPKTCWLNWEDWLLQSNRPPF